MYLSCAKSSCSSKQIYYIVDIDECASGPCNNQGSCHDEVNGFTCSCVTGYTGETCDIGRMMTYFNQQFWFPTRIDINQTVQSMKKVRSLKCRVSEKGTMLSVEQTRRR